MTLTTSEQFFYEHAGYSRDPKTETKEEARERCARELAAAEKIGENRGYEFHWEIDPDTDSSDFDDSSEPWHLWQVVAEDRHGEPFGSLGGVDFGRDGDPHGEHYARVIQAELALERIERGLTRSYHVVWRIDVDADSPEEAARKAQEIQRDPDSIATVFDVEGESYDLAEGTAR